MPPVALCIWQLWIHVRHLTVSIMLFNLLLDSNVPPRVVRVICDCYGKTTCVVRWRNCLSEGFFVKSAIRQILSPVLFNMYFDTLLCELRRNGEGCYLDRHYVGCIAYADDLILLSASLCDLQSMLDVCHNVGSSLDIAFNSSKSYLFKVGPGFAEYLSRFNICCDDIQWTDRLMYLGITVSISQGTYCNSYWFSL